MPYYNFRKIWTPLELVQIRLYRSLDDNSLWIKVGSRSRRRIL